MDVEHHPDAGPAMKVEHVLEPEQMLVVLESEAAARTVGQPRPGALPAVECGRGVAIGAADVDDDRRVRRLAKQVEERRVLLEVGNRLVDDRRVLGVEDRVLARMGREAEPQSGGLARHRGERIRGLVDLAAVVELREIWVSPVRDRLARQPVHRDADSLQRAEDPAEQLQRAAQMRA